VLKIDEPGHKVIDRVHSNLIRVDFIRNYCSLSEPARILRRKNEETHSKIKSIEEECVMDREQNVESTVREIRRKTRKKYSAKEKIRIVPKDQRS
jgi:carbonic anhydrase